MDYYVGLGIPIQVVFIYEQAASSSSDLVPLERVETAMRHLLNHHPHFTGRLVVDDHDKQPYITALGSGADLVAAVCDQNLSAFRNAESGDYVLTAFPDDLLSPYRPTPQHLASHAFFAIQHTRFACGGVALALRMAHAVVDGEGFFQVARDFANIYRQLSAGIDEPQLQHSPSIKGYMADWAKSASAQDLKQARDFQPPQYHLVGDDFQQGSNGVTVADKPKDAASTTKADPVRGRVLRFSTERQSELKGAATNPAATEAEYISTFDALCAYIMSQTYRARTSPARSPPSPPTKCNFLTPSSWRKALGLPTHHTPNSCVVNFCDLSPQEVLESPAHRVAKSIHNVTRGLSLDDAERQLQWLCAQEDKSKAQTSFEYGDGSLLLISWLKMDMYDSVALDDHLRPSFTYTPFTEVSLVDGLGYFLPVPPSAVADGTRAPIDLALALKTSVWREIDRNGSDKMFSYIE